MRIRKFGRRIFTAIALAVISLFSTQASVQATEVVHFPIAVLPPSAFKLKQSEDKGIVLEQEPGFPVWGHLDMPNGAGPHPAVVLLHGCDGISPTHLRWASILNDPGYVTFLVDSFRPRSILNLCKNPFGPVPPNTRALDAHGARAYLQSLPDVDAARIGIIGWSHGGNATLAAIERKGIAAQIKDRFSAAIAFYPYCFPGGEYADPTLILIGDSDDWAPLSKCQEMKSQSRNGDTNIRIVTYPGVSHAFDAYEKRGGVSVKGPLGKEYWVEYNDEAYKDTLMQVESFLAKYLGRSQ